ncbi:putative Hedgehog signaling attenuator pxb [Leptinotarsa decemlineata]|uniref:putative Hedgehog signaling attenuator pxb n=1 Tax=Leptinotarsa decemlineata TaxID=7539 RepID=UPI003D30A36B
MDRPTDYEDPPPGGLENMWGMETGADCDCPGPPPKFMLPPPPRPPILQPEDPMYCTEDPLPIETCDALPLIDASYRSSPSFQTSAVIVLCSVLLGLLVFIAVILIWKHKRKVQNFLPCKNSPQNNCDVNTAAGIYEDLHDLPRPTPTHHHHHPQLAGRHVVAPSIEMIDVKNNIHYPSGYPISTHPPVFLCSSPGPDPYCSQDLYNPVYEELSDADSELAPAPHSEDEFAEDELSLAGEMERRRLEMPPPPYRTDPLSLRREIPRFRRPHEPLPPVPANKRHRSLDRRRQEFHEGMLLDALLQLYPRVGSVEHPPPTRRQIPSIAQRIQCMSQTPGPYESVPVLSHLATFRPVPKPYSQDSALGSDSGYSNHTSSRSSNRGRRDPRRLSQLSADLALT